YHALVSIHRPLGIATLILVVIRFVNRLVNPPPPFPTTMSRAERLAATASELLMYGLMFVLPLVGWGMLSAARYPIVLFRPPAIALYPSAPPHALRRPAEDAHDSRLSVFPDLSRSLWGHFVSHVDRQGRAAEADGPVEH